MLVRTLLLRRAANFCRQNFAFNLQWVQLVGGVALKQWKVQRYMTGQMLRVRSGCVDFEGGPLMQKPRPTSKGFDQVTARNPSETLIFCDFPDPSQG
jgi:hypothetical protein